MDGFDQNQTAGESDDGGVVLCGFLAAEGNPLEALELAHGLLDPGAAAIEGLGKEGRLVAVVGAVRDNRAYAAPPCRLAIRFGVVSLVGQRRPRRDVWPDVEQGAELTAVAGLAAGEVEGERQTVEVGFQVDLGREAAARAAERLAVLPPFAPAAETWARTTVLSNICTR